jgi:GntR family transcriptional repressor for pyruvate dehydrogenase complex
MKFQEIVAPSIRELFVQQLEGMILSGQLKPGDRLPTERELADEMKISKTVVHEGIRELHRLGFLDVASRRGITVADYAQTGSLDTLLAVMRYHGGLPDRKTAHSLLKVRCYLESPALEELAAHHTQEDLKKLAELQQAAKRASHEGLRPFAEALFLYHRSVTFLSGNSITPLIFNAFAAINLEFWKEYIEIYGAEYCLQTLENFTECIRMGDGKKASAVLWAGVEDFLRRTEK